MRRTKPSDSARRVVGGSGDRGSQPVIRTTVERLLKVYVSVSRLRSLRNEIIPAQFRPERTVPGASVTSGVIFTVNLLFITLF